MTVRINPVNTKKVLSRRKYPPPTGFTLRKVECTDFEGGDSGDAQARCTVELMEFATAIEALTPAQRNHMLILGFYLLSTQSDEDASSGQHLEELSDSQQSVG